MTTLSATQSTPIASPTSTNTAGGVSSNNVLPITTAISSRHASIAASTTDTTKEADKQLAELYRQVLLRFADGETTLEPFNEVIRTPPENSTLGQWRSLIGKILNSPDVIQWAAKNKVDLARGITISPRDRCIVAMVSGKAVHFPSANFHAFPLLMQVAEAFEATADITYNPYSVSVKDVATFYGQAVPQQDSANTLKDRARTLAATLEDGTAFSNFDQPRSRLDSELRLSLITLADLNDKHELTRRLKAFPKDGTQSLSDFLENTTLNAHSAPAPGQTVSTDTRDTVSLKQYISTQNWRLPATTDELDDLLIALMTPKPSSPKHGDFGGSLSWPIPMSSDAARKAYIVMLGRVKPGPQGLLGYLSGNRHWEPSELRNPRRVIEQILNSPRAKELGEGLQISGGGVSTSTSANDYLLAAIHETFEPQLVPSRTNVAGFELAQPGNSGLTASAIVKRLEDHLLGATSGTGHSRVSNTLAPVAAHLLLSKRAPELLVRDIPDEVTYGSQTWLTFSTAVARIEAETPGATAMMKYADILRHGDIPPLTPAQQNVEQTAKLTALMDWGVANKLVALRPSDNYTADQQSLVLATFQKQMTELLQAVEAKNTPLPMRKDIAADHLFDALGFNLSENQPYLNSLMSKLGIPGASTEQYREAYGEKAAFYDFVSTRFITPTYHNKDFPGPYSLLDLYLSNRIFNCPPAGIRTGAPINKKNEWHSNTPNITFAEIFSRSSGFPDPVTEYSEKIQRHIDNLKTSTKTTVKYLISRLPAEDLAFMDRGQIEFYREELIYDPNPGGNHLSRRQPADNKPLVARCTMGSAVRFYEINPQKGHVKRRSDLENNFSVGHTQRKAVVLGDDTDNIEVASYSKLPSTLRHTTKIASLPAGTSTPPHDVYACARTNAIADFVTDHVFSGVPEKLSAYSKSATTFESEVPDYVKLREFLLNLIPLRSAIVNFSKGNFAEGIGDLTLDALGFVTAGASIVGKSAKIAATGIKATGHLAKIVGLAAISLLNPLDGTASLIKGIGRTIGTAGSLGIKQIRKLRGAADSYDLVAAAKRFDASALGTFKSQDEFVKSAAVLTGGQWHAYDPILRTPFGSALNDFVPSMGTTTPAFGDWATGPRILSDKKKAIKDNWDTALKKYKFGPDKSKFEAAYYDADTPQSIKSKINKLSPLELMAKAQKQGLDASKMGTLVRQYDNLAFKHGHKGAARFIDNIDPEFGTVFAMPQSVFLSSTAQFSDGQCAALSRTFATAIEQGKDKVLINNLYKAAARPELLSSREFMRSLSQLQTQTGSRTAFYAQKVFRQVTYQDMIKELSSSNVTKSLMIDAPKHAMAAGVIVDGAAKKYYFYDPNFGAAYFPTSQAMEAGLTKLFNDKTLPTPYRTHSTHSKSLEFRVFDHDDQWRTLNSIDNKKFKKIFELPLDQHTPASMSHEQLKRNWEALYKVPAHQRLNCYQTAVRISEAEKALAPGAYTSLLGPYGTSNYSPHYLAMMGIKTEHLKSTFNAAEITESGFLNFKHATENGAFGHTVYIQKTKDNELYLFNTNSPDLDVAMIRNGNPTEPSNGVFIYPLGNGKDKGLQSFLDGFDGKQGWQFAFTPASTLKANVQNLSA